MRIGKTVEAQLITLDKIASLLNRQGQEFSTISELVRAITRRAPKTGFSAVEGTFRHLYGDPGPGSGRGMRLTDLQSLTFIFQEL